MVLSYRKINSCGLTGLLPDTTDLRKNTSFNLNNAVMPSKTNQLEMVVIIESCVS